MQVLLLLDNCASHDIDKAGLPLNHDILFFPPNMTSNHQPADMGMTASAKVGYKMLLLQKLLSIFNFEGGYEGASHQHAQQKQG